MFVSQTELQKHRRTQLSALGVDYGRQRPPKPSSALQASRERDDSNTAASFLVTYWSQLCAVGTPVRYYPRWGAWGLFQDTKIHQLPHVARDGSPVIFLDGISGYVSLWHVEPIELIQLREQQRGAR